MKYNNLKSIRTQRGITISELARRAKLNRITISNIENGKSNPTVSTVVAICKVLNKDPKEIFFSDCVYHEIQGEVNK